MYASLTYFCFTNMRSKVHRFSVISSWKFKNGNGTHCISKVFYTEIDGTIYVLHTNSYFTFDFAKCSKGWKHLFLSTIHTCYSVYIPNFFVTEDITSSLTSRSRNGWTPSVCSYCEIRSIWVQRIGSVGFGIVSANPAPDTFAFCNRKLSKCAYLTTIKEHKLVKWYVPYLTSWKGRYKIPYPTGGYVFLPRAPKAQGEEILVHSHGVRCFIPPRPTVEVRHSWPVHPTNWRNFYLQVRYKYTLPPDEVRYNYSKIYTLPHGRR